MISKTIYTIYFKKCTIYVNSFSGIFLSNNKNNLSIKDSSNRALLNKFNVDDWDEYTTDLVHIKFLIKFSSIFNKIADVNELNNVEFIMDWDQSNDGYSLYPYLFHTIGGELLEIHGRSIPSSINLFIANEYGIFLLHAITVLAVISGYSLLWISKSSLQYLAAPSIETGYPSP